MECVFIYIYIYICMYVCMYIYIYIYTNVNHLTSLKNTGQFHVVSKRNAPSYAATTRSRSSHQSCLVKNVFLKISQENTSAGVVQGLHHYQKVTPTQVFSCEICEVFKNTFLEKFVNDCFCGSCFPQKCKFQMQSSRYSSRSKAIIMHVQKYKKAGFYWVTGWHKTVKLLRE